MYKYLNSLYKKLKEVRLAEGKTQKEVAQAIGITYQSYQAYEHGTAVPTLENFLKLCDFFELTPNELLGLEI